MGPVRAPKPRVSRTVAAAFGLIGLTGCEMMMQPPADIPAAPSVAPASSSQPEQRPGAARSPESQALADRYARVQDDLLARGLLREDGGGPDTPYDARILGENFVRVALFDEFVPVSGQLVARETSSRLRRWEAPVRITLVFGASVPASQRSEDRATADALAGRLARASGHDIATATSGGNMTVFVVGEDERRALAPHLRARVPGLGEDVVRTITQMPPSTFCLVIAFSTDTAPYVYTRAIAVIRSEHPPLLRRSCFHEEIAQGLGLANDSPEARPSIFNDDEEFALLTLHDELLLAILYDDRLTPGMTAAEASPVVREIAQELRPDTVRASAVAAAEQTGDS